MNRVDLTQHGINVERVLRNPSPATLYQEAMARDKKTAISDTGALIAYSGDKTGRSPNDKRVVKHADSENDIWWGPVNVPIDEHVFAVNRERAIDYLNTRETLYVIDGYAGWDPAHRIKVRVICARSLSRLVHAQHADPSKVERVVVLWRPGLRDLQRGGISRQSSHDRHDLQDQH